jgi:tRNA wybutosine-synthesizing protein 4
MDSKVQATNDDAQLSKLSCVNKRYFVDEFVHFFVRRPTKRPPLINRGYFTRHSAIRGLTHRFLLRHKYQPNQIISIGAGFDTAWFQLTKDSLITNNTKYIELDLPEVCQKKAAIISQHQQLSSLLQSHSIDPSLGIITSPTYNLHPADIRFLDTIQKTLEQHCDSSLPTLIIAECVLVYVPPDHSNTLISWLAMNFSNASIVIYDPIRPDDAFGRQMLINLEARGCPLLGISHAPTPEAQCQRLKTAGWSTAECMDLYQVHNQCLDQDSRLQAEKLEPLDEFEEWTLLMQHYCLVVGNKGTADLQLLSAPF